jgi:hypothetical protein
VIARRWLRTTAPFAAAIVTALLAALAAGAHDTDLTDPNDTRGKLDVREVRLAHETRTPIWTVVTFADWGVREMWDRGYVEVLLDTRSGEKIEYYLLVRSNRSELLGTLWRHHAFGPDSYLGPVPVSRRSRHSVSVQVGLWRLGFGEKREFYRWRVHTVFTSGTCRRTCHDNAPNGTSVLQWRPGMSPSPSVSPSPDPSSSSSP